jgi:hypothetical protein
MHTEFADIVALAHRAGWQQTVCERTRRLRGHRLPQHHHSRIRDRRTRLIDHAPGNDAATLQDHLEIVNTIAALQLEGAAAPFRRRRQSRSSAR